MKLAIIGPAVKTTKPNIHGLRNANAAHVSRDVKPANQRRTLRRGPGAVAVTVAIERASCVLLLLRGLDRFDGLLLRLVQRSLGGLLARENAVRRVHPRLLELGAGRRGRDVEREALHVEHLLDRLVEERV